jgi:hypothetical protein
MKTIRAAFVTFSLLSTLCLAQTKDAANAARAVACGSPTQTFDAHRTSAPGTPDTPSPGKSLVYIVETQDAQGICIAKCNITSKVGLDGAWVGATSGNSFIAIPVDPGAHHLCTAWQSIRRDYSRFVALDEFTAEPGKTYYFRIHLNITTPDVMASYSLAAINEDEGKLLLASSARSDSKPKKN